MHKFLMGAYGAYVWPSYLLVLSFLVGNGFLIKKQRVKIQKQLRQWFGTRS